MFVPAGQLFGPGVGIGVLPNIPSEAVPPAGAVPVAGNPSGNRDFAPSAEPSQAEPPANSAEQELRHGDGLFASRKHADALDHYIKAVEMSPQMADAWFRQGFAQSAEGEYALAAKSLRKAMELKPDWAGSSFRLATMYGNDTVGKRSRMTALYAAARRDPNDADVQFLIGAHLYFDGRADRAVQYFQHAEKLQEK
jgi:Tfp pilus assembly protein PilF